MLHCPALQLQRKKTRGPAPRTLITFNRPSAQRRQLRLGFLLRHRALPPPPPQVMLLPSLALPPLLLHPLASPSAAARELWPGTFGRPPSIPSSAAIVAPSRRKVTGLPLVSTPDRGHDAIPPPLDSTPRGLPYLDAARAYEFLPATF